MQHIIGSETMKNKLFILSILFLLFIPLVLAIDTTTFDIKSFNFSTQALVIMVFLFIVCLFVVFRITYFIVKAIFLAIGCVMLSLIIFYFLRMFLGV